MKKRFSWLLLYLFILSSCSDKYYKSAKNPHTVNYRGQRTIIETKKPSHTELTQRTKALMEANMNRKDFTEDDFHEVPPAMQVTTAVTQKYIEDYKDIAMVEMQRYNIPASITLAQGILESGSGQGRLARYGNNHFGIKCHATWNGKTMTHDDDEKSECFRRYKYAYESFEDHSQFLMKRGRYSSLFELNPTDYESWAHGLKRAGYATDPAYAKKLIALIKKFSLHQYDEQVVAMKGEPVNFSMGTDIVSTPLPKREVAQVVQNEPIAPAKPVTKKEVTKEKAVVKSAPVIADSSKKTETSKKVETAKPATPAKPQVSSQVKKEAIAEVYYQVQTGDTLYKIAREQQVPVQQLMKLNNFDDLASSNLRVGQQIRVN
ncbi:glucosaminidase domain-containing protein [Capnocytophaga leadbetteri]